MIDLTTAEYFFSILLPTVNLHCEGTHQKGFETCGWIKADHLALYTLEFSCGFCQQLNSINTAVAASIIFVAVVCLGGGIGTSGANRLGKLVRKASSVVVMEANSVKAVTERKIRGKKKKKLWIIFLFLFILS